MPEKEEIEAMFDRIAPTYDRLNHTLSLDIDRLWRRNVVRRVRRMRPRTILDLATGTGDLAIAMARRIGDARITGVDLSEKMLAVAARKVHEQGLAGRISLLQGDALHLTLPDGAVDVVTVAFGVRNFEDIEAGLREIRRVLARGGSVVVLELSTPRTPIFGALYRFYSHRMLPAIGKIVSKDGDAYRYLPASVDRFPPPDRFVEMMRGVGFTNCRAHAQSLGIARIYVGEK